MAEHNEGALLKEDKLIETFTKYVPECSPGGRFRSHAIELFAGKNILERLQNEKGFFPELKNWKKLKELVLVALEMAPAPHEWLPEWTALRGAVESWTPAGEGASTAGMEQG